MLYYQVLSRGSAENVKCGVMSWNLGEPAIACDTCACPASTSDFRWPEIFAYRFLASSLMTSPKISLPNADDDVNNYRMDDVGKDLQEASI